MVRRTAFAVALFLSPMSVVDAQAAEDHGAGSLTRPSLAATARATGSLLLFGALILGSTRERERH